MSRKRRVFDIDLPEAALAEGGPDPGGPGAGGSAAERPAGKPPAPADEAPARRSPMAAAVREAAEALALRAEREAAIRAENDALARAHVRARDEGLLTDLVPLDRIRTEKLVRDRAPGPDPDLAELMDSIRSVGLSNPIRVEPAPDGGYELVQGFRRLSAYRALLEETGEARWERIPAGIVAPGAELPLLYRRMVDENLIRKDISFAEMAELARRFAADPATGCPDAETAVGLLYRSASFQKRSYIRAFAELLELLDKDLAHPAAIPRNLGLALRRRISEVEGTLGALQRALARMPDRSAAEELSLLRRFAGDGPLPEATDFPAGKFPARDAAPGPARTGKASFRIETPEGAARLAAAFGRIEIRLARDFAAEGRDRLARAVAAFLAELDRPGD